MPKLERFIQEPLPLYPSSDIFDGQTGRIHAGVEELPNVQPDARITLQRLATQYGLLLGTPPDHVIEDSLLQVAADDFRHASIPSIRSGLFIFPSDPRFHSKSTEQLVKVDNWYGKFPDIPGVVFHAHEYHCVTRSPVDLAKQTMAKTRRSNGDAASRTEVEGKVGRSAAHALSTKIQSMNTLDNDLIQLRNEVLVPLSSETFSVWRAHYKAKNLDKKWKVFVEEAHNTLETASINLNIGTTAVAGAHRALTSRLTRFPGTREEQNTILRRYLYLSREYVQAKRHKIRFSREKTEEALALYEPFLQAQDQ
jgi:hypothetical protein